ncbi:hypothetical protein R1sor_011390 [Riccia sorocarpa]|uniref:U-box domain-containing protein n=1 Tax=Riccia sorocarpa TaxID=122646 RepID=A0ABD3I2K3_9MARC
MAIVGEIALQVIPMLVDRLITHLVQLREASKHNKQVIEEIGKFTETLNSNVKLLRTKLPKSISTLALESLAEELENANNFMEEGLSQGTFKRFWNAKKTKENLELLRRKLASAFQMAFFITSLDVGIDAHKNMTDFQERMLQLFASHRDSAAATKGHIRELLRPLLSGAGREGKVQTAIACVEEIRVNEEIESSGTEKFYADVLAAINEPAIDVQEGSSHSSGSFSDEEFYDPITTELMCDPVKGSDGFTYDRWTILDNEIYQSPMTQEPLSIVCDDVNVRRRLFHKFPNHGLEVKFKEKREEYRRQTLELARDGHDAEALERLENVLTWSKEDSECQALRLAILDRQKVSGTDSHQSLRDSSSGSHHSRVNSDPDRTLEVYFRGLTRDLEKHLFRPHRGEKVRGRAGKPEKAGKPPGFVEKIHNILVP